MDQKDLLDLFDREQRMSVEPPAFRRESLPQIVRLVPRSGSTGVISYSSLSDDNADEAIAEQKAYFALRGLTLSWKLYGHDTPADLSQRLLSQGFERQDLESVMVLELTDASLAALPPATHDVRRIEDPEEYGLVTKLEEAVWQTEFLEMDAELKAEMRARPESLFVYVAYVDGAPAAAAWIRFDEAGPDSHFASLWGGATLPAFRRRGLYGALLAVRAAEAARRGVRFLTVDAGDMSRPILEKHGFRLLTIAQDHVFDPSAASQPK